MADLAERVRAMPAAFLSWWLGELGSFVPAWLKTGSAGTRSALILDVRRHELVLMARTSGGEAPIDRAAGIDGPDGVTPLAGLGERRYRRWPLIVRLAAELGMRKIVDLPLAARADLGNLLRFELDRLTPFKPDDVRFAWRVLETDRANARMAVLLEMAPRKLVDRLAEMAAEHGRAAERVEIEHQDGQQPLNLAPEGRALQSERGLFRRILPLMVIVLALVAAWLPLDRQRRAIERLDQEITAVKAEAEESLAIRESLDEELSRADLLIRAKNERISVTSLLAELTALLPDESHLVRLEIDGGDIRLQGLADKASDLITIFERSAMFSSPQFRSPVIRDAEIGKERFQIAVELDGLSS